MRLGIVGTGDLVEALARLGAAAGSEVRVTPEAPAGLRGVETEADPRALAAWADLVVLAVPAGTLRETVRRMDPGPAARVLVATRGLEPGTGRRLSRVVTEESACLRVGALAGPILPGEVRRGSPCAAVIASAFDEVGRVGTEAFHSPLCRVYTSRDLPGVEVAGAMVEVLAMALGVARGLGLGVGAQDMLVSRGIAEGARLARREEGDPRTFSGLAGVGEIVAAAGAADHGGHVRGLALARGEKDADAAGLCDALLARGVDLPITAAIRALAAGAAKPGEVLGKLMQREQREEAEG